MLMLSILAGEGYRNDISVYGKSEQDLLVNLRQVFERCPHVMWAYSGRSYLIEERIFTADIVRERKVLFGVDHHRDHGGGIQARKCNGGKRE